MRQSHSVGDGPHPERGREPESASFAAARLAGRRGRSPTVVLAFVGVVAAVVAVGVVGRTSPAPTFVAPVALATRAPIAPLPPTAVTPATPGASRPAEVPLLTSGPGPIQIQAHRNSASMFVHGDVFVPRVTWVYLSLRDNAGSVVSWASISVPGAAGPGHGSGPTLRFDVEVAVPPTFSGPLWINANAYDADGELISSVRLQADPVGGVPPSP